MTSPTSPRKWGVGAGNKEDFRWQVHFGGDAGDQSFDTSHAACQRFGLRHNDAIRFDKPGTLWYGKRALVLGVQMGCLWVQLEGEVAAKDLKHVKDAEELKQIYGAVKLSEIESRDLLADGSYEASAVPESEPVRPNFVPAADKKHLAHFEYPGVMGMLEVDGSPAACAPFGFHHGETVRASVGFEKGRTAVVVGVHSGSLYVHFYGDKAATSCYYCTDKEQLLTKYGFTSVAPAPAIPDAPPTAPPSVATAALDDLQRMSSTITDKHRSFEYPVPFGMTQRFDRTEEATKPFGVRHGQILAITKGMSAGHNAVVVGVCNSTLWIHEEGDRAATACKYCSNAADLESRYGFRSTGETACLEEGIPYFTAVHSAAKRSEEADVILQQPLDDEQWTEGAQPQTYRFLRSYARWRLPKTAPRGQAFMLYYVQDTAARTTEALENLSVLRKFWSLRREQGHPQFRKPFADASEGEIYRCLQQVPLRALTILSSTAG
eukprot:TRINITY_DN21843_c0_g1_i1.p1 TRINITY_DN21843_c0_g1~~TRINITY_DN21843_c0_g1_i1.p1  ORF type:complete len:492 (+),score=70.90 TRINITY_DN21843_c0_g1_i1:112-1587(+)